MLLEQSFDKSNSSTQLTSRHVNDPNEVSAVPNLSGFVERKRPERRLLKRQTQVLGAIAQLVHV